MISTDEERVDADSRSLQSMHFNKVSKEIYLDEGRKKLHKTEKENNFAINSNFDFRKF